MDKATASDWIGAIEELTKRAIYEKRVVHLIGFSMGAMIAAIIASRHSIRTLVLLSPAVYIVTPNVLLTRSRRMVKLVRENRFLFSQAMRNEFTSMGSAPLYNVLQFQKVIRDAKKGYHT
ncbi:hypothetical protein [Alicyclobacillus fastidiosus]|uniref:hypothetical protein n=1 Tax=Alicyclobacillus fastidiosus TaxID=392011 RepID=UPI0024E07AE4|nr:hypothetical protein [Alicyclobacillus fastidiosus]